MFRKFKLATVIAVALSAGGTMRSAYAGGHGPSGHSGHSHSGGSSFGGGGFNVGGFKVGGNSMPHVNHSNSSNGSSGIKLGSTGVPGNTGIAGGIKSLPGNTGIAGGLKNLPKNTGIVGGIKLPTNTGVAGGIKTLPKNTGIVPPIVKTGGINNSNTQLLGKSISTMDVIKGTNALKNFGDKIKIGGLGIAIGEPNPSKPGNGNGNGNGNQHHHHNFPPLIFTLPVCQPNYCPPPCPPVYYPQPYPVAVPVPVPVDANGNPIDPNAVPAAPPMGLPMETKKALEDTVATQAPASQVQPASATTEVVSKEMPLPQIPVGATLTLNGKDLTEKEGQVVLQLGEIALPATIKEWKNDSVTCTLPVLGLTKASKATLHVLKADGKTASTLNCELVTTLPTSVERNTTTDIEAAKYEQ